MKVIIVAGPTATGKTEIAIKLAKKFNGELINADSQQVYKGLNIGTNKGNIIENNNQYLIDGVPIHLVNILKPEEKFNLFTFQKLALETIKDITQRGKLPIIVGGTGLYIDSIVKGYELVESNNLDREKLEKLSVVELQSLISKDSLAKLNSSDLNNPRRLIRVVERSEHIGTVSTEWDIMSLILYPIYDWEVLKNKLDLRVEHMFENGIIEETKNLISMGLPIDSESLKIMGYKQVVEYLNKRIDLNTCKERVKIAHKQYAKRQRTWFEGAGRNYSLNRFENIDDAIKFTNNFINNEI